MGVVIETLAMIGGLLALASVVGPLVLVLAAGAILKASDIVDDIRHWWSNRDG